MPPVFFGCLAGASFGALAIGTVLIVLGGGLLAWEWTRPQRTELIGPRVVAAAALVVAGGAVVGMFR